MLENVSVQIPMVIFFNPAEPEATLKRPQSFGNDKTYLVSKNTFIFGSFRTGSSKHSYVEPLLPPMQQEVPRMLQVLQMFGSSTVGMEHVPDILQQTVQQLYG